MRTSSNLVYFKPGHFSLIFFRRDGRGREESRGGRGRGGDREESRGGRGGGKKDRKGD